MDLVRSFCPSSLDSTMGEVAEDEEAVATDLKDMEAAEILTAFARSKNRDAVSLDVEFSAKWGCKGKRVRKRVSSSESPPSDIGLNPVDPVQSCSGLAEDRSRVSQQQIQVASTTAVMESIEAEHNAVIRNMSHHYAASNMSNGVSRTTKNAEKETHGLHSMLTNNDSDFQMIPERQILFNIVGIPEKDVREDKQQGQMTGNVALVKSVKAGKKAEPVKSSPACVTKYMSGGRRRSGQNLTEAEKEERRLCRILANRESARQTIRRRQALCENLTLKVADLTREKEILKRAKELAMKEYLSQESTNKNLKAEMAKAIKADQMEAPGEVKLVHQISGPSRNNPFLFYNQHPFVPFWWPSIVQSSHPLQSQCGQQHALFVSSSISPPTNGMLDLSHDQEDPRNVNGPKSPLYVVPYPCFFSLPDHGNGLHPHPCGLNGIKDEASVNNAFGAGCSLKSVAHEEYNPSLLVEDEKEAYGSHEASSNNMNYTPIRPQPDGGGIRFHVKEEVLVLTPPCSAGTTFVEEQENKPDHVINTEVSPIRACQIIGALLEDNQELTNSMSKEVQDAVTAAEARRKRKELIKLKNLQGRQCRVQL
ncbi:hypothetical protein HRI_000771000 [Hibiscus trionum]|uniref:BZIP domain-containing protein n=1 Tax=Hibiscus trionum TaxID=183268 RepID=A0A9W7LP70_HIBTR|nr:hypothetical protein HRI_000771000 [Hibiscus trionum]